MAKINIILNNITLQPNIAKNGKIVKKGMGTKTIIFKLIVSFVFRYHGNRKK